MKVFLRDFTIAFVPSLLSALIAFMLFKLSQMNERKRWLTDAYIRNEAKIWIDYRATLAVFINEFEPLCEVLDDGSEWYKYCKSPDEEYNSYLCLLIKLREVHLQAKPYFYDDLNDDIHGNIFFVIEDLIYEFENLLNDIKTDQIKVEKLNKAELHKYKIENFSDIFKEYFFDYNGNLEQLKVLLNALDKRYLSYKNFATLK